MSSEIERVLAELGERVQAYQSAVDDYDRELARLLGVNETDLRCLELLIGGGDGDGLTPSELGTRLGLTTGSVTAMLDRLEKLGLLTRTPHPVDRRKSVVRVTEAAAVRCFELLAPHMEEGAAEVRRRYDVAQLKLITDFLATVTGVQNRHVQRLRETPGPQTARRRTHS
jgi:DNA-binding MarR family transcriptional regulator